MEHEDSHCVLGKSSEMLGTSSDAGFVRFDLNSNSNSKMDSRVMRPTEIKVEAGVHTDHVSNSHDCAVVISRES